MVPFPNPELLSPNLFLKESTINSLVCFESFQMFFFLGEAHPVLTSF